MADFDIDLDALAEDSEEFDDAIEPGSPSPENVIFVLLGITATITVVLRLAGVV
ncbi:MAG: hypothetical protein ABEJ85_02895 [Haloarculaceae archaeon]